MKTPITPLKVERTKGFFNSIGEASSLLQLSRFTRLAGLTTPADIKLFAPYTVESLGRTKDYLQEKADQLRQFFSDVRVMATQKSRIEVAVTELHCPRATGVKAKLLAVRETEEAEDFSIEILGIGGGDEYKTTFSVGDGLETSDGACIAAVYSVLAVFESCELDTPDGRVQRFVRLKGLEPNSEITTGVELVGSADACQTTDFDVLTNVTKEPINLEKYGKATFQKTLSLSQGSTWKGEAKISLEEFGIKLGATYEGKRTTTTDLEYTLVGGFDYLAIKPKNKISWLWRVTT